MTDVKIQRLTGELTEDPNIQTVHVFVDALDGSFHNLELVGDVAIDEADLPGTVASLLAAANYVDSTL